MNIKFDNLKKVCNLIKLEFTNWSDGTIETRCTHNNRKTWECNEKVCPLNNKSIQ